MIMSTCATSSPSSGQFLGRYRQASMCTIKWNFKILAGRWWQNLWLPHPHITSSPVTNAMQRRNFMEGQCIYRSYCPLHNRPMGGFAPFIPQRRLDRLFKPWITFKNCLPEMQWLESEGYTTSQLSRMKIMENQCTTAWSEILTTDIIKGFPKALWSTDSYTWDPSPHRSSNVWMNCYYHRDLHYPCDHPIRCSIGTL